jgi:hypothetical protein
MYYISKATVSAPLSRLMSTITEQNASFLRIYDRNIENILWLPVAAANAMDRAALQAVPQDIVFKSSERVFKMLAGNGIYWPIVLSMYARQTTHTIGSCSYACSQLDVYDKCHETLMHIHTINATMGQIDINMQSFSGNTYGKNGARWGQHSTCQDQCMHAHDLV